VVFGGSSKCKITDAQLPCKSSEYQLHQLHDTRAGDGALLLLLLPSPQTMQLHRNYSYQYPYKTAAATATASSTRSWWQQNCNKSSAKQLLPLLPVAHVLQLLPKKSRLPFLSTAAAAACCFTTAAAHHGPRGRWPLPVATWGEHACKQQSTHMHVITTLCLGTRGNIHCLHFHHQLLTAGVMLLPNPRSLLAESSLQDLLWYTRGPAAAHQLTRAYNS
jgi:hypothetical protein